MSFSLNDSFGRSESFNENNINSCHARDFSLTQQYEYRTLYMMKAAAEPPQVMMHTADSTSSCTAARATHRVCSVHVFVIYMLPR